MNNYEVMGWKDSWIVVDGWKKILTIENNYERMHQARTMNLEENGARFKRNSSSVFKCWEWWWEPPWIVEILWNENWKGWTNDEKNLKDLGERHMTDDNPFLRQALKRIFEAPGKLEESGKILGKDLWVRAHSKEHRWKDLKEMLHRLN